VTGRKNPRVAGIIQARMTSARLPGKVLREVLGKPLIEYELERLRAVQEIGELIVATTVNGSDDAVVALYERLGVKAYRGSESDVLSRFHEAASLAGADVVVRFTADCPLIDPSFASSVIADFLNDGALDYMGTDYESVPRGMDTEVFTFQALGRAYKEGLSKPDREHVTWYIHKNPDKFRVSRRGLPEKLGAYRLTVDTPEDFSLIEEIITSLYPADKNFTLGDIISLLDSNPELRAINGDIKQKKYE